MKKNIFRVVFMMVLILCLTKDSWALFQLSVTPRTGGQTIHFSASDVPRSDSEGLLRNEEVTVSIDTNQTVQYRLLQNMYQPLTNEFGNTIPSGSFVVFSPSNPLGTLRTQLETPVSMGQSQIYTSNNAGGADEFLLVFNVRVPENQPGGLYRTQLTYTAEPVNAQSAFSPSTVTLDVRVEINPKFQLNITNEKGIKNIDLGRITKERKVASQNLKVDITSNAGTVYRIFQQLTEPLASADGKILSPEQFTFSPTGNAQGSLSSGANTQVPLSQNLLYTSNEWGVSDSINLQYFFTPEASQKSGIYRGVLSFRVESTSPFVPQEVINLPVTVEIESIFSLDVSFDKGRDLNFGVFKAGEEKQERRVFLSAKSNLGLPYQISQIVPRRMTHVEGQVIPKESFQFSTTAEKTNTSTPTKPVEDGETVIYISDNAGTPEDLTVNYTLMIPKEAKAGSYTSELKYSITTL